MFCTSENGNASCFQRRRRFVGWLVVLIVCWGTSGAAADEGLAPKTTEGESPDVKRVLLVTGEDYPGHKWKETTPVLAKAIGGDERLQVEIAWETTALTRDDLAEYDGIVLHFKNYDPNVPGPKARKNLERFVADGGGLVLVHFACGAFQEWPEFERLAGRVWDPKLRGHDPHGPFTVHIVDHAHPITHAMEDFETVDELYTCLAGKTPIRVLANATSKVDGKAYPMAFVLEYGKGRVFHSPLGHDVKALSVPEVAALFRRGTAWSVGLDPQ